MLVLEGKGGAEVRRPANPGHRYFTCQQHHPENFWNPAFQTHANGATAIAGVVMVAENPADRHVFLKAFAGVSDLRSTSHGIRIETPRGEIQAMESQTYRFIFAVEPPDLTREMSRTGIGFRPLAFMDGN